MPPKGVMVANARGSASATRSLAESAPDRSVKRPVPVSAEDRAKMVQPEDVGDLVRYIACLPKHIVINEVMITPTWNRGYVADLKR